MLTTLVNLYAKVHMIMLKSVICTEPDLIPVARLVIGVSGGVLPSSARMPLF